MSGSTNNLEQVQTSQAQKEVTVNELFDAHSPASLFGRRAPGCIALTWAFYGGTLLIDGTPTVLGNDTVTLANSTTNYVERDRAGEVTVNATAFTPGRVPLYTIVTAANTVTSYLDHREVTNSPGVLTRGSRSVAGGANVTLTAEEARNGVLSFTGTLTGSIEVIVPDGPQAWIVRNGTAGAFTLTLKTAAGTGVAVDQGTTALALADGTNVSAISGGGGGGLANFTDAANSSSPNTTVTVASLKATGAATDIDAVLSAKGVGAILAQIPDSTSTGGNKRGSHAVDFQKVRNSANQVASGLSAFIAGGQRNRSSGSFSLTAGYGNEATADTTFAAGDSNVASGTAAIALGNANTCSSNHTYALGRLNVVNGQFSVGLGNGTSANGISGRMSYASGAYSNSGDCQWGVIPCKRITTNATPADATTNNGSASSDNVLVLQDRSACIVTGTVVAREHATGDCATWKFEVAVRRGVNAAATAIVGTATVVSIAADAGAAAWAFALTANTTLGALVGQVTGEASKTLRWSVVFEVNELQG